MTKEKQSLSFLCIPMDVRFLSPRSGGFRSVIAKLTRQHKNIEEVFAYICTREGELVHLLSIYSSGLQKNSVFVVVVVVFKDLTAVWRNVRHSLLAASCSFRVYERWLGHLINCQRVREAGEAAAL